MAYNSEGLTLKLFGTFQLKCPNGSTVEIASKKGRALIALLVTSHNGERTRSWLQNILWCRGSSQDSLRKELSILRAQLLQHGFDLFPKNVPRDVIRIDRNLINNDLDAAHDNLDGEFLEGLDLPYENNFEDWLRENRAFFDARKTSAISEIITNDPEMKNHIPVPRFCIGISPIQWGVKNIFPNFSAIQFDEVLDRISRLLLSSGGVDIQDFRHSLSMPNLATEVPTSIPRAQIFLKISESSSSLVFSIHLLLNENSRVLYANRKEFDFDLIESLLEDNLPMREYIAETVNEVLYTLSRGQHADLGESTKAIQLVHEGIEAMFDLSYSGLDKAQKNFGQATEMLQESVIYAWRAYLTTQLVDDPRITDFERLKEETKYYASRALELDRYNPLTLSLLTHVNAFVLKDLNAAADLMSQAKSLNSDHVMTYDADALLNLYMGDIEQSRASALEAARLGKFLPFRYLFMTSLCMIDGLAGNFETAILSGEKALKQHPSKANRPYPPTIRYLAQNYARVGKEQKAFELVDMLRRADEEHINFFLDNNVRAAPTLEIADFLKISHGTLA